MVGFYLLRKTFLIPGKNVVQNIWIHDRKSGGSKPLNLFSEIVQSARPLHVPTGKYRRGKHGTSLLSQADPLYQ
jgi:hypothetical protein